ncbi:hypothetical protein [Desulfatibacillum aliphaticivorans]|uniref:hypothetical protein n=1 Tax=Desulfatibacillum aliphaticivorans TaxID=218208 RepID=UPI0012F89C99|nr:hypothetical protein [Desulfatibacillum aliphaticivorans]
MKSEKQDISVCVGLPEEYRKLPLFVFPGVFRGDYHGLVFMKHFPFDKGFMGKTPDL